MANQTEQHIIKRIEELATLLDGSMQKTLRCDYTGRQSKIILIEYDVKETK